MGVFSQSSHHGDGSRAWDAFGPAPAFVLAHPDRPDGMTASDRGWSTSVGAAPGGSASCLPTRKRRSLGGGATEMLGRVFIYAYVVLLAASLLLEQPIPLAIGP
jgi:hypothetical protein